ncbi:MAG TPA: cyanophycin synthetase, partial [Gemmatimonadaceae bacterium]|nr:cyanophycin synthetase [Gemmatimonadaceae bacterium]
MKVGFITLGCDKNTVDTERYLAELADYGGEYTSALDDADVIIVNTCGFIDAAKKESIDAMLDASRYKITGACQAVVGVGCMVERHKAELVEALPADGTAVLNADDERVRQMGALTSARVVTVGESPGATVRAVDVTVDDRARPSDRLRTPEGEAVVRPAVSGRHQVGNTLAAAAVARAAGLPLAAIAAGLADLRPVSTRRMDVFDRPDGVTVIDDSYNANPASTAAALRALVAIGTGRRRFAVLGYLAELGEYERAGHEEVGRLAADLGVDRIVVVGPEAAPIHDGATAVARWG